MDLSNFSFKIPQSLIAVYPCFIRSKCRLLVINGHTGKISHKFFFNILNEINSGDLMVFNDTEVISARLFGYKKSGGKVEVLLERILNKNSILASIKSSNKIKINSHLFFGKKNEIKSFVTGYNRPFYKIDFYNNTSSIIDIFNNIGYMPLPPYIKRFNERIDLSLYQTVYKKNLGSVAAPTAGLHFDLPLLEELNKKGVDIDFLTLHIGSGTFQPIRTSKIEKHIMHSESVEVSSNLIKKIKLCKKKGGRIIAVGTTTLRALESAYHSTSWKNEKNYVKDTNIFIYPGYKHNVVDALITNFHFPESTLIMLVSSFLGYKNTISAYHEAIKNNYRFFSYGDAMYITYNKFAPYEKILI
ncbi:tRNA preQ1(34) S-adenosylmethionine ribosyltransferase-isomerase QueA [uncultured Buchnera sp.]|jgi:S-adenosylmethionine:tRNA ribosyltransferase-isomerase|uniref:tRNA preQ1(34) S-adenosylmethionine ribosyltransferase-isomerase QueA n=1 Tax=uncultured Buchnera sp. TaxID=574037 RepID=UPI0025EA25E8|nr:tRNA preQ1(34) S-adenosylmethionine ribosyltransferase-isomerase QueA [uncultured Buchnera sp.]